MPKTDGGRPCLVERATGPARGLAAAIAVLATLVLAAAPGRVAASADEDEVKAAFLLNFTRFVDWPASSFGDATSPFVICVLDDAGFASTASKVIGDRTVGDRAVSVSGIGSVDAAGDCHILYVPSSQRGVHETVIATLADSSVFTVSDADGFAEMGGIANFKRAGSKLGLEINRKAASQARLKVSSRLLRIADVVG